MKQIVLLSKFIVLGIFDNLCSSRISGTACESREDISSFYDDHKSFSGLVKEIYMNKSTFKANNFILCNSAQSVCLTK